MDADNYNKNRGIYSPLIEHNKHVVGFWLVGNNYQNKSPLFGTYPPGYLKRMRWLFDDEFTNGEVLHLFSGAVKSLPNETTFDINHDFRPSVVGDATNLTDYFKHDTFDLVLADPPYDDNHVKYGTEKVNKKKVVSLCAIVVKNGGYLVWLDTIMPIWAKKDGWAYKGSIGLLQSTNHKVRVATILRKG